LIRSPSVGVRPVVGSVVMSLTEKIPNCMACSRWLRAQLLPRATFPRLGYSADPPPEGDADHVADVAPGIVTAR
jgi:hypothetical protein